MSTGGSDSTQQQPHVTAPSAAESAQGLAESPQEEAEVQERGECPICKMMREGGCEQQFQAFMECGAAAEKGELEVGQCLKMFDAMKTCMEQNPAVFGSLLQSVQPEQQTSQTKDVKEAAAAQLS